MVKMHKLTKGGQTIFPATITDAVVNPNSRKSLTAELSEFSNNVYSPIKEIYVTGVSQLSSPTFNFKKKTDGKLYFNATSNGEIIAAGAWDLNDLKDYVVKYIEDKTCVISTLECEDSFPYRKIEINSEKELVGITNIMTINDYVKMMVMSYQNKYPDTELSKKLGISRKSLWEKRKKLDIEKKK